MYNQLKYLTAAELQKQNSLLNKQIVKPIIYSFTLTTFYLGINLLIFSLQNNLSYERITITQMLVDLVEKKKANQKYLIKKLEAQNIELVSKTLSISK